MKPTNPQMMLSRRLPMVLPVLAILLITPYLNRSHCSQAQELTTGSLVEIKGKPRAHLIVFRATIVDARGDSAAAVAQAVLNKQETEGRFRYTYAIIAMKLNKYIREYRTLSDSRTFEQADSFIVFNLVRYRRILDRRYPSGEMFVISLPTPDSARVLWRTEKEMLAEDAVNLLIRELKTVNGQR